MTHCTCDRPEIPRANECELHPVEDETDPIKARIAEARAALANAKTPDRRSK